MIKILVYILCLLAFMPLTIGQTFCNDSTPLDTIFTLDTETFARKEKPKFAKIDTGFMITKTPECDSVHSSCKLLNSLKGKAFVLGTINGLKYEGFRVYELQMISKGGKPALVEFGQKLELNIESGTEISGEFWPEKSADKVKYLHSTFDERSLSIVHIIFRSGVQVLYTYSLEELAPVPRFVLHEIEPNYIFKGFFHMVSNTTDVFNRTQPNDVYAIGRTEGSDSYIVFEFTKDLTFNTSSSITLDDLYRCPALSTTTTTQISSKKLGTTRRAETSSKASVTTVTEPLSSTTSTLEATSMAATTEAPSKALWIFLWIMLGFGVMGLIIIIVLIFAVCYIRERKPKEEEKVPTKAKPRQPAKPNDDKSGEHNESTIRSD